jgi:hypothetical protein
LSGKTTLALHLLLEGMEMVGDELVLLRDGLAAAFPRKFYPRESSLALLPDVKLAGSDLPFVTDTHGAKRIAIDPAELGRPWRIARAPVKAVFYLDPDFLEEDAAVPMHQGGHGAPRDGAVHAARVAAHGLDRRSMRYGERRRRAHDRSRRFRFRRD